MTLNMESQFSKLSLINELLESLSNLGYMDMTPIQEKSLPLIIKGNDVIAQAKTGSGKTAAFGLGILNSLNTSSNNLHSLILCPTRELAEQVASELRKLSRALPNVKILTLCGGSPENLQDRSLKSGVHIAIGTPGRVLQHLKKGSLNLDSLNIFTLDEADRMLDMGFEEELNEIISHLPKKKQSLLFSATYPENIASLSERFQKDALKVQIDTTHEESNIEEIFYEVSPTQDKNNILYKILSSSKPKRVIVFCRTKKETADVADFLLNRNIKAKCINGDLEQNERNEVLAKFSNRSLSILVATDVAARGLDIKDLEAVINYNMPSGADAYIHRIGRTGRAGKKGLAFSFFNPAEEFRLNEIKDLTKKDCIIEDPKKLSYKEKYNLIPPMKTMYISGGKKDKIRKGDILGALTGEAKMKFEDIGEIHIFNAFSFVAIKRKNIDLAIKRLSQGRIKKKKFKVGLA